MDGTPPIDGSDPAPAPADLTPQSLIRLDYFAPPEDIAPQIITFFRLCCDEPMIRDVQPAVMGQLYVYLAGEGRVSFADGRVEPAHPVSLMSPLGHAAPFEVAGPLDVFGVVLGPLGWAALTGLDAAEHGERMFDAIEILGPHAAALGEAVRAIAANGGEGAGEAMRDAMAEFLRRHFKPLPPEHVAVVQAVVAWLGSSLSPPLDDLYASLPYSERQVQRLVARFFGSSPAHLVRKYRATRVAALLAQPDLDEATVALLTDQFYDQSHMIREIREFIGRTPSRIGSGDAPILDAVVNVRNFYHIKPHVAPMPPAIDAAIANNAVEIKPDEP